MNEVERRERKKEVWKERKGKKRALGTEGSDKKETIELFVAWTLLTRAYISERECCRAPHFQLLVDPLLLASEVNCPIIRNEASFTIDRLFPCSLSILTPCSSCSWPPYRPSCRPAEAGELLPARTPAESSHELQSGKMHFVQSECDWGSDCPSWPNTHTRDQGEQGIPLLALPSLLFASYCSRTTPAQSPSYTHIHSHSIPSSSSSFVLYEQQPLP